MSEELFIDPKANKTEIYESLIPQFEALITGESDITANLANLSAALKTAFNWLWVGFYLVKNDELVLGPFQGPIACTRIKYGRGVCGTVWKTTVESELSSPLLVPDVEKFPGHIACSSSSVSEIVVPVLDANNQIVAVLDVDSERYDVLDETDLVYLNKIAELISKIF